MADIRTALDALRQIAGDAMTAERAAMCRAMDAHPTEPCDDVAAAAHGYHTAAAIYQAAGGMIGALDAHAEYTERGMQEQREA